MTRVSRRAFLGASASVAASTVVVAATKAPAGVVDIGSRRELFVDGHLLDRLEGGARRRLCQPSPQEVVLPHDAPWEGSGSGYHSVFRDGELYRLYYKAAQYEVATGKLVMPTAFKLALLKR